MIVFSYSSAGVFYLKLSQKCGSQRSHWALYNENEDDDEYENEGTLLNLVLVLVLLLVLDNKISR
jgi:hypothetical protein